MSRITPGTVIVGIFAVLFGLVGAYGVRKSLQREVPPPAAPVQPRPTIVPLASMDLEQGRVVVLHDIGLHPMSNEQVAERQKDGRLPAAFMRNTEQIMGQTIRVPLKKGDAFTPDVFYPDGEGPTIAEKLDPGLRAVTISVDGTGALGGFDGPGSIVDILFRSKADEAVGVPEATVTLLEGVQVLAMEHADARRPPGSSLDNRVTLAVTAAQANALKIAEGRGTFSLALRNPDDVQVAASNVPQTLDALLNLPGRQEHITQIFRGGIPQAVSFANPVAQSQPVLALPVAGALQMRAAQQTTSLEKNQPEAADAVEAAPPAASPPEQVPAATPEPVDTSAASAPSSRPAGTPSPDKPQGSEGPSVGTQTGANSDSTMVTVQIPASVLAERLAFTPPGSPESRTVLKPAAPSAAAPGAVTEEAEAAAGPSRPRKLLSDIGKKGRTALGSTED